MAKDLRLFKQLVLQKYPNITKSQLAEIDNFINEKMAGEIANAGVPISEIAKEPDLRSVQYEQVLSGEYQPEQTETQKKTSQSKKDAEELLNYIESEYFTNKLYNEKKGVTGRISGKGRELTAKLSADKEPKLKAYLDMLDNLKPKLARAFGDVGNLSQSEQMNAIKQIPRGTTTKEEAELNLKNLRQTLGLTEFKSPTKKVEPPKPVVEVMQTQTQKPTVPPSMVDTLQRLAAANKVKEKTALEVEKNKVGPITEVLAKAQKYLGEKPIYPIIGGILGETLGGPLGATGGAAVGKAAQTAVATGNPLKLLGLGVSQKEAGDIVRTGAGAGLSSVLFKALTPMKTLGKLRTSAAQKVADKGVTVSGEKIAEAGMKYAETAPASARKTAQRLAEEGINKFSGKELSLPQALSEKAASWSAGYTASRAGKGATAGFERAIGSAIKEEVSKKAPSVARLDKLFSTLHTAKQVVKQGTWEALKFGALGRLFGLGRTN